MTNEISVCHIMKNSSTWMLNLDEERSRADAGDLICCFFHAASLRVFDRTGHFAPAMTLNGSILVMRAVPTHLPQTAGFQEVVRSTFVCIAHSLSMRENDLKTVKQVVCHVKNGFTSV